MTQKKHREDAKDAKKKQKLFQIQENDRLSQSGLYQQAIASVSEGDYERAVVQIQRYLQTEDQDGPAWNDAGVILYNLSRYDQAAECLGRAARLIPYCGDVYDNLLKVYLAAGTYERIAGLVEMMHSRGCLNTQTAGDLTRGAMEEGSGAAAMETVLNAIRLLGDNGELAHLAKQIRSNRPRLAFFCGGDGDTFLRDIYHYLSERFEVRRFGGNTARQVQEMMAWSDISWFEWCSEFAQVGTSLPKSCVNIIRLHRYEAYTDWPGKVNWGNVDVLVTVGNSHVRDALQSQVPGIAEATRIVTIPNGVDMDRVRFRERTRGKNIAFVGDVRMVKNPMLLLQCIKAVHEIDAEYKLYWAGKSQDMLLEQYIRHAIAAMGLEEVVIFDGWQDDIQGWLAGKHYIACSSVIESQGMGVLEAMAAGLKPIVHNFPGASETFGEQWLFNTPGQFCRLATSGEYEPGLYRRFVEQKYALKSQLQRINGLIVDFELSLSPSVSCTSRQGSLSGL